MPPAKRTTRTTSDDDEQPDVPESSAGLGPTTANEGGREGDVFVPAAPDPPNVVVPPDLAVESADVQRAKRGDA